MLKHNKYNIILRRVYETIVAVEKQKVLHTCVCACVGVRVCVCGCTGSGVCLQACSFTYPSCNVQSYCHVRPLWLHHIFGHYLTNGINFGKKLLNIKRVF